MVEVFEEYRLRSEVCLGCGATGDANQSKRVGVSERSYQDMNLRVSNLPVYPKATKSPLLAALKWQWREMRNENVDVATGIRLNMRY